jgi:hypothetical protein
VSVSTSGGVTTASFSTSGVAAGSHAVTANYSGGGSFLGSTGTLASGLTVSQANTGTLVVASANPVLVGQSVQLTATVLSALWSPSSAGGVGVIPTGVVSFYDGTTLLGQATLNSAAGTSTVSISTSNLAVGGHTITAVYGGDHNYLTSKEAMTETVVSSLPPGGSGGTSNLTSTTTTLLVSAQKLAFGQPIMLNAMVNSGPSSSGPVGGSLTFLVQGKPLASYLLSGTNGAFTVLTLPPGQYTLSATYSGDSTHAGSTSSVTVTVGTSNTGAAAVNGGVNGPQVPQTSQPSTPSTSAPLAQTNTPNTGMTPRQLATAIVAGMRPAANSYQEFLKRPTDHGGLNSYLTALNGGVLDQGNVGAAMLDSGELLGPIG